MHVNSSRILGVLSDVQIARRRVSAAEPLPVENARLDCRAHALDG